MIIQITKEEIEKELSLALGEEVILKIEEEDTIKKLKIVSKSGKKHIGFKNKDRPEEHLYKRFVLECIGQGYYKKDNMWKDE